MPSPDIAAGHFEGRANQEIWTSIVDLYLANRQKKGIRKFVESLPQLELAPIMRSLDEQLRSVLCSPPSPDGDLPVLLAPLDQQQRIEVLVHLFSAVEAATTLEIDDFTQGRISASVSLTEGLSASAIRHLQKRQRISIEQTVPFQYQETLLRTGRLDVESPFGNGSISCAASLLVVVETKDTVRPFPVYFFQDTEPFFVYANPLFGDLSGWYFPHRNLVLQESQDAFVIPWLKALMVEFAAQTRECLNNAAPKPVALTYGVLDQIGHTILNELEAVHQLAQAGALASVDLVIKGWTSFVDQTELFPELAGIPVRVGSSPAQVYEQALQAACILVRPTCKNYWFSTGLRERFDRLGRATQQQLALDPANHLSEVAARHPIIWFELRSNRRHWVGQTEGIAIIVNELRKEFPNLGVILAGWSRFSDAPPRAEDMKMITMDHALAVEIKSRIDVDIPVWDITGVKTRDKIAWCLQIDAFAAVQSSGLVFPVGMAGQRGVVHANAGFKEFARKKSRSGLDFIEDCPEISYVDFDKAKDVGTAKKWWAHNYELPWEEIYVPLRAILSRQIPHRLGDLLLPHC